jgi:hypothetical protein
MVYCTASTNHEYGNIEQDIKFEVCALTSLTCQLHYVKDRKSGSPHLHCMHRHTIHLAVSDHSLIQTGVANPLMYSLRCVADATDTRREVR